MTRQDYVHVCDADTNTVAYVRVITAIAVGYSMIFSKRVAAMAMVMEMICLDGRGEPRLHGGDAEAMCGVMCRLMLLHRRGRKLRQKMRVSSA